MKHAALTSLIDHWESEAAIGHVSKIVIDMHDAVVPSQTIKVLVGAGMLNEWIALRDVRLRGDVPELAIRRADDRMSGEPNERACVE